LKRPEILIICTHLGQIEAAYRRLSYFIKYLKKKKLKVRCAGFLQITGQGLLIPSRECYEVPLIVSTSKYAIHFLPLNFLLSLAIILLILILRPQTVIVSIPDSFPVLASHLGCTIIRSKLVIDIRDPQEEILMHMYNKKRFSSFIVKIYKKINYAIYRKAHAVIGVTRFLAMLLATKIGRNVRLITNGADLNVFKPIDRSLARRKLGLNQNSFLMGFAGTLTWYYDVLPVLVALRKAKKKLNVDIKLIVAGPLYDIYLKNIFNCFRDVVTYLGVLEVEDIVTMLSACDIGIIPRVGDPIYNYAVPAKFYEYVATGLPLIIVANKESELAKIVEENKLGFVCEPEDQVCLENLILTLANNRNTLNELKRSVLVFRRYIDRRSGAERLYRLIKELLQE